MDEVQQGSGRGVGAANGVRTLGKWQAPGRGGAKLWPVWRERLCECGHSLGP